MKTILKEGDECPWKECHEKLEVNEYGEDEARYLECPTKDHYREYLGLADDLDE